MMKGPLAVIGGRLVQGRLAPPTETEKIVGKCNATFPGKRCGYPHCMCIAIPTEIKAQP